jgi:hypothetical protein
MPNGLKNHPWPVSVASKVKNPGSENPDSESRLPGVSQARLPGVSQARLPGVSQARLPAAVYNNDVIRHKGIYALQGTEAQSLKKQTTKSHGYIVCT